MGELPRISIVTPCLNAASTIGAAIESVLAQDYGNWEHLVQDGGSTDKTLDLLKRYPRLNWVSEKDQGHYDAMNRGLARATGDVIVILNADDCFRPGVLRRVAEAFRANPGWDALFGDVVFVDGEGREIYRRQEARYDYKILLYGVDYICHQTLFVRRTAYERLGGYRHKEFRNSADYEFKLRLGRMGCSVGHVPELLVDYRYHTQGQSADLRIIRNMIQEAVIIRREYGNPGGWRGSCLRVLYKAKRQLQKLWFRHTCDFVPGTWRLKPHLRRETNFSSNAGLDKL
jgi:glycosyltransferase involved in cell wall biosynthesis